MKCANQYCDNEIDKANCVESGIDIHHRTYWCSDECYDNHINGRRPEDKDWKKPSALDTNGKK